jgi:hypothetical protein
LFGEIFLCVVFKCNYMFNCRMEFKNLFLRVIFGGEMENWTGGFRKLQWSLGNGICGGHETFRRIEN